jgi:VCBS repeat-containing protein
MLKTSLNNSITGALQGQAKPNEQLSILPCSPNIQSDHAIGAEATQVKVTVSETCSAIAYNRGELETKARSFLTSQESHKLGTGYTLFGSINVAVTQAAVSSTTPHLVFLSFKASGTWTYGISSQSQQQIKHLIAGKSKDQAEQLLAALPGIESAAIRFTGFTDEWRLPKNYSFIHVILIVV